MRRIDRAIFVLVAVLTTIAVRSSEAIQCYDCCSLATDHCKEPFSGVGVATCQGRICIKTEVMALGKSWILRRCDRRPFPGEIIAGVKLFGIGASVQACSTDFCNGPVPQPIPHTVPITRARETIYAAAPPVTSKLYQDLPNANPVSTNAPPVTSKLDQDSPNANSVSTNMSHQQQRTRVYALLATSVAAVLLAKLLG